jgi:fatty acid desaturase
MLFHETVLLGVLMATGWGFFTAMIGMTSFHDANHFAITHKPWVWNVVGTFHDFYLGNSMIVWINQHVLGHHPYTNIDGADPDIVTDTVDIRRIKWSQKWMPRYVYQHIYVPFLYCALGVKTRLQDLYIIYSRQNANIRVNRPTSTQLFLIIAGKLTHCIYRFLVPWLFMPWTSLLLYNIAMEFVFSYWLALTFQASHVVSEVEWPKPDPKDLMVHRDWAEMQVATTQDYATDSWFWTVFTGALNHQTAHHLFPGVNQGHYPIITSILQQTCQEFGLSYHHIDSAWEAINCHFNHLKTLGQKRAD